MAGAECRRHTTSAAPHRTAPHRTATQTAEPSIVQRLRTPPTAAFHLLLPPPGPLPFPPAVRPDALRHFAGAEEERRAWVGKGKVERDGAGQGK